MVDEPLANEDGGGIDDDFDDKDGKESMGVITKLEHFDYEIAQKFLRKDGWMDVMDAQLEGQQFQV